MKLDAKATPQEARRSSTAYLQVQRLRAEHQAAFTAPPPHCESKTAPAHLFVVRMLLQWSLFNRSPPVGPQVLEVVLGLLLAALLCPARTEVFMCQ